MCGEKKPWAVRFFEFKQRHPRFVMSVLLFFVVPVTAGSLMGYEMKADVAITIPTVIVDHDNSDFSRTYAKYIEDSDYFNVIEYAENDQRVEELIYKGEAYAGVIIPENFYQDMLAGKSPVILSVLDGSTLAVIVSSKTTLTEILLTVRAGYLMNVFEGKQDVTASQALVQAMPIDMTSRLLYNPTKSFRNFILPGMLCALVQISMVIAGAESGYANQKRRLPFGAHLAEAGKWSLLGVAAVLVCIGIQLLFFDMPFRGTFLGWLLLTVLFSACITLQGYVIGYFLLDRTFGTQIACVSVLPTAILGGYTWPVLAMPPAAQVLVKLIPFTYYGEAVRKLCLKPVRLSHLSAEFLFLAGFLAVMAAILFLLVRFRMRRQERAEAAAMPLSAEREVTV